MIRVKARVYVLEKFARYAHKSVCLCPENSVEYSAKGAHKELYAYVDKIMLV